MHGYLSLPIHHCHITQNWRGRPLIRHEVVINLIAATKTQKGLTIEEKAPKRAQKAAADTFTSVALERPMR
jgi:hypothetical protein